MKVLTKYEVSETRELSVVEIFGLIALVNKNFVDDECKVKLRYQQTCLQPEYVFIIDEGEVNRIGMVGNRIVFEINLLDENQEPTEEAVLYWADVKWGELKLTEIVG